MAGVLQLPGCIEPYGRHASGVCGHAYFRWDVSVECLGPVSVRLVDLWRSDDPFMIDWIVVAQRKRHLLSSSHADGVRLEVRVVEPNHNIRSIGRRGADADSCKQRRQD